LNKDWAMQEIKIQLADNGVIKTVIDDNINGAGESFESTNVYEFNTVTNKIKFIDDLCVDIGLELGNSKSKSKINISSGWGEDYLPTPAEIDTKIQKLQSEISRLQKIKNG